MAKRAKTPAPSTTRGGVQAGDVVRGHSRIRAESLDVLGHIARLLVMNGESPRDLEYAFAGICRDLKVDPLYRGRSGRRVIGFSHVISRWHLEPRYLDASGEPRALRFSGGSPSLKGLISRIHPGVDPREVLESLMRRGALSVKAGVYRPTGRVVLFGKDSPDMAAWQVSVVRGLLQTLEHNATSKPADRLPARIAINPHFPRAALPAMYDRMRRSGTKLLHDADNDMQRQEVKDGSAQTTALGIAVFAFEEPLVTGQRPTRGRSRNGAGGPKRSRGRIR